MNLIQQAVERVDQIEREGKAVIAPPPPLPQGKLHGVQSRSFRPTPLNPSRVPLAALGLAVLAVVGGALLYVALVRTQGNGNAASAKLAQASPPAPLAAAATSAKALPISEVEAGAPTTATATAAVATPVTLPAVVPALATTTRDLDDARAAVESWAHAWSERDVNGYLAHYGDGFTPERGASRMAWEKSRRQMIERRRSITVNIANLRLERVSDSRIVVRYVQDYAADAYRETGTPKRLVLAHEGSGWRIVAETADPAGTSSS